MKYHAFLSYSHADEAAAAQLHRALERYAIPRRLRRAHGLPARLYPVFRDVEELAAGASLSTRLRDALDASRWLIVLCSPKACESKYVASEIEHFLGRHGPERILCVLLEGEPPGCLPPALRALPEEPLAADLRPGADAQAATLKLVAAMTGIAYGELSDREALRRRFGQRAAAAALALPALGAAAWWELYQRDHVEYYEGYVRKHGIWTGVDRVDAIAKTGYRFTRLGRLGPPRRVDYLDASGRCPAGGMDDWLAEHDGRFKDVCVASFEYLENEVAEYDWQELGDNYGHYVGRVDERGIITVETAGQPGKPLRMHFLRAVRDEQGYDRELWVWSSPGVPGTDRHGNYGYALTHDDAGHETSRTILGPDHKPIAPKS